MVLNFLSQFAARRSFSEWLAIGGLCLCLAACSSGGPTVKEQTDLQVQVAASVNVNPDDWGRAAPIMVRVYELKSATAFESADFFTLQNDSKKALGDDVLAVDEFILRPGDKREIRRKSNQASAAIGVLAGYRDLGKSVWRDVYRLPTAPDASWYRAAIPDKKQKLVIRLDQRTVSITESE
ncbi:type VI secretion system lipoprotein TssJ [Trinickia terrae]|uniref:Type VI secretion system lipoprotein TssJ n=1 Tax=Trinickia terrae TaxID=2571161 RepID=A0A4U1I7H2_9BURK|nr:type VI secretion system lipoprotein TssJ [Trinickia terrae]TKC89361.1 type VI secretion system lipoprotein TssJ [Trinickia terrae]